MAIKPFLILQKKLVGWAKATNGTINKSIQPKKIE